MRLRRGVCGCAASCVFGSLGLWVFGSLGLWGFGSLGLWVLGVGCARVVRSGAGPWPRRPAVPAWDPLGIFKNILKNI